MGYRSDVKLITTQAGAEIIKRKVTTVEKTPSSGLLHPSNLQTYHDGKYVLFNYEDIKWYEHYDPAVVAFMKGIDDLRKQNIPYKYARIGEDYADAEYEDNLLDVANWSDYQDMPHLSIERKIEVEE